MANQTSYLLDSLLNVVGSVSADITSETLKEQFNQIFTSTEGFKVKVSQMDALVSKSGIPVNIGEMLFDLLLFHFFSEDLKRLDSSYFETAEWQKIENATMDRGTELMNLLLYLQECRDAGIRSTLDDYLDEYLITEEDYDHEDYEIYEAIIKNRELIGQADRETISAIMSKNSESMLGEQLLPLLLFFNTRLNSGEKQDLIRQIGEDPVFQTGFLMILIQFTQHTNE